MWIEISKLILEYLKVLIWPVIAIFVLVKYRPQIENILGNLKKAELPGGISFETFPEDIKEAKELSEEVKEEERPKPKDKSGPGIPLTEANARMLNLGLDPSPSGLDLSKYKSYAEEDPNLAVAGIRMEIEIMLKNLAKGFKLDHTERMPASKLITKLRKEGKITFSQERLTRTVLRICNTAVHGLRVTKGQVDEILGIVSVLRDDYIDWLSWGFPNR